MTTVYCVNVNCIHNVGCGICSKDEVFVGDGYDFGCRFYENYRDTPDYQHEFYMRVRAADGKEAKGVNHGKILEYNGYTFFITNHPEEKIFVTEKRTGVMWGSLEQLKNNPRRWLVAVERSKEIGDVEDLPLTEYNEKTRNWEYVKNENRGSEKEPQ